MGIIPAYEHAVLAETSLQNYRIRLTKDDGRTVYDIEFYADGTAKDIMEPIIVGDYESRLLQLQPPSAGMRTYRLGRDAQGQAIEYSSHIIPGKKCTLVFDH